MAKYDFNALPVLGADRKLLGVITVDDVMDVLTQEQTEDMQRLAGVEPTRGRATSRRASGCSFASAARGSPCSSSSEFFTGTALRHYDAVIEAVAKLSYYVPLLISTGGNTGSQSATLIIRGLAVGDIKTGDWRKRIPARGRPGPGARPDARVDRRCCRVWMWGDGSASCSPSA